MGRLLNSREAAGLLGVKRTTVNNYTSIGKLRVAARSIGGRPLYDEDELLRLVGREDNHEHDDTRGIAFYARSSNGDESLIQSQLSELTRAYGEPAFTYTDKASGLNEKRKGLDRLLNDAEQGKISTVYITNRDRLTRFGYEYLERLLKLNDVRLISLHEAVSPPHPQEELIRDFMSLLASFSGKYYRLRSKTNSRRFLEQVENGLDTGNGKNMGDETHE